MENQNQLSANQKIGLLDSITGLLQARTDDNPTLTLDARVELATTAMTLVRDLMTGNFKS